MYKATGNYVGDVALGVPYEIYFLDYTGSLLHWHWFRGRTLCVPTYRTNFFLTFSVKWH